MRRCWRDEGGATSIEYALIASLIAVLLVATFRVLGTGTVAALYGNVANGLSGAGM